MTDEPSGGLGRPRTDRIRDEPEPAIVPGIWERLLVLRLARGSYRLARRIVIGVTGTVVVLVGIVLLVMPGPAFLVIPLGLAILALEFVWARRLLRLFRVRARQMMRDRRRGNYRFWSRWWRG